MYKTEEFIIKRLLWKATQSGIPSETSFLFKDLSPDIQLFLTNQIDTHVSGVPVLFFTKPTKEWTLICTRQAICFNSQELLKINFTDIERFKPTVFDSSSAHDIIKYRKGKHSKKEWDQVTVFTSDNSKYVLHAAKGSDLFAMWNILLMAARLYDKQA